MEFIIFAIFSIFISAIMALEALFAHYSIVKLGKIKGILVYVSGLWLVSTALTIAVIAGINIATQMQ